MAESETPEGSPGPESKTQREARLRRERRNAKIQAGGSERLNKISSMSGRPAAAEAGQCLDTEILTIAMRQSMKKQCTEIAVQSSPRRALHNLKTVLRDPRKSTSPTCSRNPRMIPINPTSKM